MTDRALLSLATRALFVAVLALALGIVATVRADEGRPVGLVGQSGEMSGMEHGAAAPQEGVPNATARRGGRPLVHTVDGDTWVFELVARPVKWEILPDVRVTAWTYNGTVPGPEIRVPYGQKVRVIVKSELPDPTAVHWHGIAVPNAMDGVPGVTQDPIAPGETFTYAFRALPTSTSSRGGTFMYHSHFDEDRQVGLRLSAPFVIEPEAEPAYDLERTVLLGEWNLDAASGDTEVVAKDGVPLATPYEADVVDVAPGERYDLLFTADKPGKWVFHCHIGHHLTNDGEGPGGLLTVVDVAEQKGRR